MPAFFLYYLFAIIAKTKQNKNKQTPSYYTQFYKAIPQNFIRILRHSHNLG